MIMIDREQSSSIKKPVRDKLERTETNNSQNAKSSKKIIHSGFPIDSIVQQYVQYAYEIGWMDLVTILECENWHRDMYRQSDVVEQYWRREQSYWFCQIHRPSHPDIVDNPLFRSDWKRQLDRCKEIRNRELNDWRIRFNAQTRVINWVLCPQ